MCVLEASDTIRCVLWTACSRYRLNPKPGTYATSINVILWSVFPWKAISIFSIYSTLILRRSPNVVVSRRGEGGLKLYSLVLSCVMWHGAPLSAIQTSSSLLPDCTMNALCKYLPGTLILLQRLHSVRTTCLMAQKALGWPGRRNSSRTTRTERAVHAGPAAREMTVMVEKVHCKNRCSLQNINTWQLVRPRTGQEGACSI